MPDYNNSFDTEQWRDFGTFSREFDVYFKQLTDLLGSEFISYLQSYAQMSPLSGTRKVSISFSVDANIVYGEVLAIMNNKPSFLSSFIGNPILELYASNMIEEEVLRAIDRDLPTGLDKNRAKGVALNLLIKIRKINLDKNLDDIYYKHAYDLIGNKAKSGPTDAQYLGVAFLLKTHGVISKDKIFNKQSEVKVWKLGTVGRVLSELTSGSLSIFILENSANFIFNILYYILGAIIKFISWLLEGLITFTISLISSGAEFILDLPDEMKQAIGIGVIAIGFLYLISEGFRGFVDSGIEYVKTKVISLVETIKKELIVLITAIKQIFTCLFPFVEFTLEGIGYMFYSVNQLNQRLTELENI